MSDAFDLDQFAPPPVRFKLDGHVYTVSGDVDVDRVARMLRVETAIEEADGIEETVAAVREGRELLLEMIRERDPDVDEISIGSQALLVTFALILHGSSVAAAVAEAISQPQAGGGDGEPGVATADGPAPDGPQDADAAPLASETLSSGQSSGSDARESGLLVTGSG